MNYKIERAKENDIDIILNLIYERLKWFKEKNYVGWDIDLYLDEYDKDYFLEQIKINELYALKINNKICGVMLLKKEYEDYWEYDIESYYIHHLGIDIHYRNLGNKLIEYAIKRCRETNKKSLRLDCYKESKFLNSYYASLGFKNVGNGIDDYYVYNLWEMKI